MSDYQKMYYAVCAGVSNVVDEMPETAAFQKYRQRLIDILQEAEDIYIETADDTEEKEGYAS